MLFIFFVSDSEWEITPWLELQGRDLGDPHTTTDSWANPDCSVSGAGHAAAAGRLPAGVINTTTAKKEKKLTMQQFQPHVHNVSLNKNSLAGH